jgi:16S rRNA processing protein RimM
VVVERFTVALVGAPFGLKGFVKIRSLSGEYEHITRLSSVILRQGESEQLWEIEGAVSIARGVAVKFRGVDTPEEAKNLNGAEVIADRDHAAPLKEGEFYVEDLQGLAVITDSGEVLGRIIGILDIGCGNFAEIRLVSGEVKLAPFRNEFFGEINLETRRALLLCPWVLE